MKRHPAPAPRSLGAGGRLPQPLCTRLVVWLRCRQCHAGYFATGAPGPRPCPACAGGRLHTVAVWDLGSQAAPPGMLHLGEVAA